MKHLTRFGFIYGNKQTLEEQYVQVLHLENNLTLVRNIRPPGHHDLIPSNQNKSRSHNLRLSYLTSQIFNYMKYNSIFEHPIALQYSYI
jgi:hypothetical protein